MKQFDAIIFDLDGTLWDTTETCVRVWNQVADEMGVDHPHVTAEIMRGLTGKPHDQCIADFYNGLSQIQLDQLNRKTAVGDNEAIAREGGHIYAGVGDGLVRLKKRWPLMIVSNCQAGYIETFFDLTGFGPLFTDHECWGRTGRSKSDNLATIMERNGLRAPLVVGDTEGDGRAARDNGVPFAHVSYGFGQAQRPELVADDFGSLVTKLIALERTSMVEVRRYGEGVTSAAAWLAWSCTSSRTRGFHSDGFRHHVPPSNMPASSSLFSLHSAFPLAAARWRSASHDDIRAALHALNSSVPQQLVSSPLSVEMSTPRSRPVAS